MRTQAKRYKKAIPYTVEFDNNEGSYSENKQLKEVLLNAIQQLPANQSAVVKLFYIESYSLKQISELLQISEGTAKSRLFYAREELKKTLKNYNYEY